MPIWVFWLTFRLIRHLALCWRYRKRKLPIVPAKRVIVFHKVREEDPWREVETLHCDGVEIFGYSRAPEELQLQIIESVSEGWTLYYYYDYYDPAAEYWKFEVQ